MPAPARAYGRLAGGLPVAGLLMVRQTDAAAAVIDSLVLVGSSSEAEPKIRRRLVELLAQHRLPGASVGAVRDQILAWSAGVGFADLEAARRPHADAAPGRGTHPLARRATVQPPSDGRHDDRRATASG